MGGITLFKMGLEVISKLAELFRASILPLFADDMSLYIENNKDSTKNLR